MIKASWAKLNTSPWPGVSDSRPSMWMLKVARVALFQDGVPITQIASAYGEMFDVDRVEVEKGPQSTLHGRSALNGGISIFQKMPGDTLGLEAKAGVGDHGQRLLQAVVNIPVSDILVCGSAP